MFIKGKRNISGYISKVNSNCKKKKKKNSINDSKQKKKSAMTLSCSKKLSVILKRMIFVAWVVFIL